MSGKRRTQFLVGLGGGLALIIVIIIVATSGGGGGGQVVTVAGGDTRTVSDNCKPVNASAPQQGGVPTMKLLASGAAADADCPPSGQLTLGSVPQNSQTSSQVPTFAIQTNAVHVPVPPSGEGYLLWLWKSNTQSVPLGPANVDGNGNLTATLPVPAQELLLFPAFQTLKVTKLTSAQGQQIQQSIQSQGKKPTLLVPFVGTTVLEGSISELGLTQLLQQAQAQAQAQGGASPQAQQGAKGRKG
jgi:hypothetical protein